MKIRLPERLPIRAVLLRRAHVEGAEVPRDLPDRPVPGVLLVPDEAGRVAVASGLLALVGPEAGLVLSKLLAVVVVHESTVAVYY